MKKILITENQLKKIITEKVSSEIYFNTFSGAVQKARKDIEDRGLVIDDDDWWREVNTGKGRPKEGETTRMSIGLYKNEKKLRKYLHIQVYNRGNNIKNNFELNYYIG